MSKMCVLNYTLCFIGKKIYNVYTKLTIFYKVQLVTLKYCAF